MKKISQILKLSNIYLNYMTRKELLSYTPIRLWIEPTNICNLRCNLCPTGLDSFSSKGFMDLKLYKKIINECRGFVYDINLTHRGEPLLHPDIVEMITIAKSAGIKVRVHTNATRLTHDMTENLLNSELDLLSFSFDGFDKESYEKIRIGGIFENTLSNILNFLQMKKEMGRKKPYTIFQVIEPLSHKQENEKVRLEFQKQFEGLPLDKFYVKPPHNWGGSLELSPEDSGVYRKNYSPCTFCWYSLTIFWDGVVVPCPQDYFGKYIVGDINKSTLRQIWNEQPMLSLRKDLISENYQSVDPCKNCDRLWRNTLFGIPTGNLKAFLTENIIGYRFIQKIVKK